MFTVFYLCVTVITFVLQLSCSPATPKSQHMKLIFLLILILLLSFCLVAGAILTGFYTDWNIFGFMVAECLLLIVRTVYVIMK